MCWGRPPGAAAGPAWKPGRLAPRPLLRQHCALRAVPAQALLHAVQLLTTPVFTPHPSHQPAPQKGGSAAAQSQAQALGSHSHPISAGGARAAETEEGVHAHVEDRGPREQWSHNTAPHPPGVSIFIDCSFRRAQAPPPETVFCNVYPRQEADSASPEGPS